MASFSRTLLTAGLILLVSAVIHLPVPAIAAHNKASQNADVMMKCQQSAMSMECEHGLWPVQSDPLGLPIPERDYVRLYMKHITLRVHDFQPLPAIKNRYFSWLSFTNMTSIDRDGKSGRFPLQEVVKLQSRTKITVLDLEQVNLAPKITFVDFDGFTALETLKIDECNIVEVDPRTFYALISPITSQSDVISKPSTLRSLTLYGPDSLKPKFPVSLTTFPWESLTPVAGSLETITIMTHHELTEITYELPDTAPRMYLNRLRSATLSLNQLRGLSQKIVDTLNGTTSGTQWSNEPVVTDVSYNVNKCGSCDLVPLIKWARNRSDLPRKLKAFCVKDAYGAVDVLPDTLEYWQSYPIESCKEIVEFPPTSTRSSGGSKNSGISVFTPPKIFLCIRLSIFLILITKLD